MTGWETFGGVSMGSAVLALRPPFHGQEGPQTLNPPKLSCEPPFWAMGCHLQTIAGEFLPCPVPELPWELYRLELDDGDAMAIRALEGSTGVAVILFHGITGSSGCNNMRRAAAQLHKSGHAIVAVNHRGAGEGRGWARNSYHSGSTMDMAAALRFARERFPDHLQVAIGFSISANILLLLMGRDAGKGVPDLAIAVNPPVDLEACSRRLVSGFNLAYDQYLIRQLRSEAKARLDAEPLVPTPTTRVFDDVYTAAMAGFPDRDAYYSECSCGPHLATIRVPTVIISSMDDPLAPAADILEQTLSPMIHLHIERFGGHLGYVSGNLPGRHWLDYSLTHYVRELLSSELMNHLA